MGTASTMLLLISVATPPGDLAAGSGAGLALPSVGAWAAVAPRPATAGEDRVQVRVRRGFGWTAVRCQHQRHLRLAPSLACLVLGKPWWLLPPCSTEFACRQTWIACRRRAAAELLHAHRATLRRPVPPALPFALMLSSPSRQQPATYVWVAAKVGKHETYEDPGLDLRAFNGTMRCCRTSGLQSQSGEEESGISIACRDGELSGHATP